VINEHTGYSSEVDSEKARLLARIQELEAESEQLRVQLGGCGVAALGWNKEPVKQGDYGWSASYQEVLNLRRKYEALSAPTPEPREGGE
jgi:hypothetical protein